MENKVKIKSKTTGETFNIMARYDLQPKGFGRIEVHVTVPENQPLPIDLLLRRFTFEVHSFYEGYILCSGSTNGTTSLDKEFFWLFGHTIMRPEDTPEAKSLIQNTTSPLPPGAAPARPSFFRWR